MPSRTQAPPVADITTHLRHVKYPADKDELLRCARDDHAPEEALTVLAHVEDRFYGGVAEVTEELERARARARSGRRPGVDEVQEASEESFPASDPPASMSGSHIGKPPAGKKTREE